LSSEAIIGTVEQHSIVELSTTFASCDDAMKMASSLLENKLVACSQVSGPITSLYRWDGIVQSSEEFVLRIKTSPRRLVEVCSFIQSHHPYELPEVVWHLVNASLDYSNWVHGCCE
jgi:periplasmic divalent cation tolerance protein